MCGRQKRKERYRQTETHIQIDKKETEMGDRECQADGKRWSEIKKIRDRQMRRGRDRKMKRNINRQVERYADRSKQIWTDR